MPTVIPVGFFRELKHGHARAPSLHQVVQTVAGHHDARAVQYLKSGVVLIATPGLARDVLDPKGGIIGPPHVLTDGIYAWPADLAWYVEKHHARLPVDFLAHMAKNGWVVPANVDPAGLELGEERDPTTQAAWDKQGEELARAFLTAHMTYDDPEVAARREAEERAKEREDRAALSSFYLDTGQLESGVSLEDGIGRMLRRFADRIEEEAPDLGAVALTQPLPDLARIELATSPDGRRDLLLSQRKTGGRVVSERLETGTNRQLIAWLRSPEAVARILAALGRLRS